MCGYVQVHGKMIILCQNIWKIQKHLCNIIKHQQYLNIISDHIQIFDNLSLQLDNFAEYWPNQEWVSSKYARSFPKSSENRTISNLNTTQTLGNVDYFPNTWQILLESAIILRYLWIICTIASKNDKTLPKYLENTEKCVQHH